MKIKRLTPTAIIPTRGSKGAAGYDLYADSVDGAAYTHERTDEKTGETKTVVVCGGGSKVVVHTGIAMAIPKGYVGLIFARSGLACKRGLRPSNCVGVIDEDYRGELMVNLYNDTDFSSLYSSEIAEAEHFLETANEHTSIKTLFDKVFAKIFTKRNDIAENFAEFEIGERIAQIVFVKYEAFDLEEVDDLDSTERGTGGFGSTGTN